ncbi:MAG: DEAD/DEAH box helicase [archaeon]
MKLYAYTFPTYFEKSWIKVGDTSRTVEERVHEQFGTSNPEEPVILKEWDIKDYRDHNVHAILKNMGLIRVHNHREWFECTVDDISAAVNKLLNNIARPNAYSMRDEQEAAVEKAYNYFQNIGDEFLWNAKMRFGKTFAAYQLMKRMNSNKTLILTYKPGVVAGWKSDLNNHVDFVDYEFLHALDFDKNEPIKFNTEKSVLFASFQDVLGNTKDLKEKWKNVLDIHYDLLIIDEVHFGANSKRAQEFLSLLNVDKTLVMSGTPIKLLMGGVYDEEQTYTWSYIDEQKKRNIEKENGWKTEIYRWLPVMHLYTYKLSDMTEPDSTFYSEEEGLTLNKFFGSDDGKNLNNDAAVGLWLDNLATVNKRKFHSPLRLDNVSLKHMYWYLSGVNNVKALANKLRGHSFFKKYVILAAADDNEGMGSDTLAWVKDEINKVEKGFYKGKVGTITLSCGKLNTGVSVPEWNSVWMLSDTKAVESYMQTIFRAQTSWKEAEKENAYVFDFNPNRALEMIYDYNEYIAENDQSTPSSVREFIDCFEVLSYEDNEFKEVDVEKIVEIGVEADTALKKFGSERMVHIENASMKIAELLVGIDKAESIKQNISVSENDTKNGKTFHTEREPSSKKEKDIMKDLLAKAVSVTKAIPSFLFDSDEKIESVNDIISTSDIDIFEDDVHISIDNFKLMIDAGFFNVKMLNRSIEAFNLGIERDFSS